MKARIEANGIYISGRFGAWVGIGGNIFLSLVKFVAGLMGRSSAMVADAVHSLSDVLSSVIVLAGLRVAQKRPDSNHPYGHSKAESVAAQIVSVFLVFLGGMIFLHSWRSMNLRDYRAPSAYVLLVALLSIVVKEGLFQYKNRLGKRLHSSLLIADAWHHRSDAFSSIAVLVGVSAAVFGGPRFHVADHVAAMAVAVIIGFTGIKMLRTTSSELMDQVVTGSRVDEIRAIAGSVHGVLGIEKLFVRKSGMEMLADVHIEVDSSIPVQEGHEIAMRTGKELKEKIPSLSSVMVHVEPYRSSE